MDNDARLHELTKEELIKEYKQMRSSRDRVFSIASHDLRSPFSGLLGLSEMLSKEADTLPFDELNKYLSTMHDSLKNTYQLLENLFEWSQIERGKYDKTIEKIPLSILVEEVLESLRDEITAKGIEVVNHYDYEQIVETNSRMLEFVLKNLISNSIKYSERNSRVEIRCNPEGEKFILSVKDYGIGISEENVKKLFSADINWRLHGTEGENGTGLGLLASSRFAESFGAEIQVESTVGEGSTFMLILSAPPA